jgi:hypothetical protein
MRRQQELDEIERFLRTRGATYCPTRFAAGVAGALPRAEEAALLACMRLRQRTREERWAAILRAIWGSRNARPAGV